METRPAIRGMVTGVLSLFVWLCLRGDCAPLAAAHEQDAAAPATGDNARAASAADYVRELVEQMQVRDAGGQSVAEFKPQVKPLLSYNDLARGYLAAGVWRLGERGRPEGLVSVEYWLRTQPIDRYENRDEGIVDGAAFVFAYGTNPELLLLLECDASGWQFGLARMSWAETVVELDGVVVKTFEHIEAHPTSGPYQTAGRAVATATRAAQDPGQ
jgi:hypothetical protein